jgi:hypothetical protein
MFTKKSIVRNYPFYWSNQADLTELPTAQDKPMTIDQVQRRISKIDFLQIALIGKKIIDFVSHYLKEYSNRELEHRITTQAIFDKFAIPSHFLADGIHFHIEDQKGISIAEDGASLRHKAVLKLDEKMTSKNRRLTFILTEEFNNITFQTLKFLIIGNEIRDVSS